MGTMAAMVTTVPAAPAAVPEPVEAATPAARRREPALAPARGIAIAIMIGSLCWLVLIELFA